MLQAAFGGHEGRVLRELEDSPQYYEPGFNIMSPLEIEVENEADVVYILLRKRSDSGGFENLETGNISVTATDATNGEEVFSSVVTNSNFGYEPWVTNPSEGTVPLVLSIENEIDISNPILRVRVVDCIVSDTTDNDFITFRIIITDGDLNFHYIPVSRASISDRNEFSIEGREAYVTINKNSDTYVIFSPYSWISETTKNKADFSYPEDSIYYRKQETYNNEDFSFALVSYGDSFIENNISVMNIPSYGKAGIILIDRKLYANLLQVGRNSYADILVTGELSGRVDTFRVNFYRGQ